MSCPVHTSRDGLLETVMVGIVLVLPPIIRASYASPRVVDQSPFGAKFGSNLGRGFSPNRLLGPTALA